MDMDQSGAEGDVSHMGPVTRSNLRRTVQEVDTLRAPTDSPTHSLGEAHMGGDYRSLDYAGEDKRDASRYPATRLVPSPRAAESRRGIESSDNGANRYEGVGNHASITDFDRRREDRQESGQRRSSSMWPVRQQDDGDHLDNHPHVGGRASQREGRVGSHFARDVSLRHSLIECRASIFDGKQDWRSYYAQFQMVAEYNQWSAEEQVIQLVRSLSGPARTVLADMSQEQLWHLPTLVAALERRYQPREKTLAHKAIFNTRRQKPKEDISTFGESLRLLAVQAFPGSSASEREARIIDRFLEGLQDTALRKHLYLQHLDTFEMVLSAAIEWEALDEAIQLGGARKPTNVDRLVTVSDKSQGKREEGDLSTILASLNDKIEMMELVLRQQLSQGRSPGNRLSEGQKKANCRYCHQTGHQRHECHQFLQTVTCFKCQERGHFARECPRSHTAEQQQAVGTVRDFSRGSHVSQMGNY